MTGGRIVDATATRPWIVEPEPRAAMRRGARGWVFRRDRFKKGRRRAGGAEPARLGRLRIASSPSGPPSCAWGQCTGLDHPSG